MGHLFATGTHIDCNFFGPNIGFDIISFEHGSIVEHWEDLQETARAESQRPHMIEGPTEEEELARTEASRTLVPFVDDIVGAHSEYAPI